MSSPKIDGAVTLSFTDETKADLALAGSSLEGAVSDSAMIGSIIDESKEDLTLTAPSLQGAVSDSALTDQQEDDLDGTTVSHQDGEEICALVKSDAVYSTALDLMDASPLTCTGGGEILQSLVTYKSVVSSSSSTSSKIHSPGSMNVMSTIQEATNDLHEANVDIERISVDASSLFAVKSSLSLTKVNETMAQAEEDASVESASPPPDEGVIWLHQPKLVVETPTPDSADDDVGPRFYQNHLILSNA